LKASTILLLSVAALIVLWGAVFWAENTQNPLWNSLRPLESVAESLKWVTTGVVFLLAAGMLFVSAKAFEKNRSNRFLFLTLAFGIIFAKFGIKLVDAVYSPGDFFSSAAQNVFDLFVLIALFLAIMRKD